MFQSPPTRSILVSFETHLTCRPWLGSRNHPHRFEHRKDSRKRKIQWDYGLKRWVKIRRNHPLKNFYSPSKRKIEESIRLIKLVMSHVLYLFGGCDILSSVVYHTIFTIRLASGRWLDIYLILDKYMCVRLTLQTPKYTIARYICVYVTH